MTTRTADELTQDEKLVSDYLSKAKILIADVSAGSRTSISTHLGSLGAQTANTRVSSTFRGADEEIDKVAPDVLIADYDLGNRCGLELFQKVKTKHPELNSKIFMLVTGNTSQSAVAKAAEEDVDTYLLKPFTKETLRQAMSKAILLKIKPNDYLATITAGKTELSSGNVEDAGKTFEKATGLDQTPSLAYYYLGLTQEKKKSLEFAREKYMKGLTYNRIHYKCMTGLFDLLIQEKKHEEAYDIAKRISQYFPANPQRLTSVLRLAILTKSYEDVEKFYQIFLNLDERSEEMIKYICAALVVCGKYYLQSNFSTRAMELYKKATTVSPGRPKVLREIVTTLVAFGKEKSGWEFLKMYPANLQTSPDYLAMELLLQNMGQSAPAIIERCKQLLSQKVEDPVVYEILIKRLFETGVTGEAQELAAKATGLWPDQKAQFASLSGYAKKA